MNIRESTIMLFTLAWIAVGLLTIIGAIVLLDDITKGVICGLGLMAVLAFHIYQLVRSTENES